MSPEAHRGEFSRAADLCLAVGAGDPRQSRHSQPINQRGLLWFIGDFDADSLVNLVGMLVDSGAGVAVHIGSRVFGAAVGAG